MRHSIIWLKGTATWRFANNYVTNMPFFRFDIPPIFEKLVKNPDDCGRSAPFGRCWHQNETVGQKLGFSGEKRT